MGSRTCWISTKTINKIESITYRNKLKRIKDNDSALDHASFDKPTSEEIAQIAEALEGNTNLKRLYINNSNTGDEEALTIAKALNKNSSLEYLDLSNTNMTQKGIKNFIREIGGNTSITSLVLSSRTVNMDKKSSDEISRIIERNKKMKAPNSSVANFTKERLDKKEEISLCAIQ